MKSLSGKGVSFPRTDNEFYHFRRSPMENLIVTIREKKDSLPKRQRALCSYILDNPVEASMLTITELANRSGIGTATVVRTIQALGYDSVSQFKSDLRSTTFAQASTSYNAFVDMGRSYAQKQGGIYALPGLYSEYLKHLSSPAFFAQFENAADLIVKARRVFILGLRSSLSISFLLEYQLKDLDIPLEQISLRADYVLDRIVDMGPEDLLLCIAAPPMTKRTGEVIRICHSRGVPVVMLTTTRTQPIGQKATVVISCEAFGMPLTTTPTTFAAEMLVHAVAERCKGNTRTQRVEEMLREHNIDVWDPET